MKVVPVFSAVATALTVAVLTGGAGPAEAKGARRPRRPVTRAARS